LPDDRDEASRIGLLIEPTIERGQIATLVGRWLLTQRWKLLYS
jgi:hypothetical protein